MSTNPAREARGACTELEEALIRTKVAVASAKRDDRTFVLLYTDDALELLKRLSALEHDCQELLS